MDDPLISTAEAARMLNVTPDALRMWRYRRANLAFIKIGSRCMYRTSDIKKFIETNTYEAAPTPVKA